MLNISQSVLTTIIGELNSAISYHEAWFDKVSEILVCRVDPDEKDIHSNAHHNCKFGQWYYNHAHMRLQEHPAFQEIGPLHAEMHANAAVVLKRLKEGTKIPRQEYHRFSDSLKSMRTQINNLTDELMDISRQLDPLTGVYTRGGMLTKLRNDQEKVKRGQYNCSIIMLDLDDFKHINDHYGHAVGDMVLHHVGAYLCDNIRIYDDVYRYGGEEFLIVMQDCEQACAVESTRRLCEHLSKLEIENGSNKPLRVSASFGVYELEAGVTVTESIARADHAMYKAKQLGKNQVASWTEDMCLSNIISFTGNPA